MVNASGGGKVGSTVAEGIGDELGLDQVPCVMRRVWVEVHMNRGVGGSPRKLETARDTSEGLDRTEEGVRSGVVAHLFAMDDILLVKESESDMSDHANILVMQRCSWGRMWHRVNGEGDLTKGEGLRVGICGGGECVLGRA